MQQEFNPPRTKHKSLTKIEEMKDYVYLMTYDRERYEIPYSEIGSWLAYMQALSYVTFDAGNCQIAFSDKFSKYRKIN